MPYYNKDPKRDPNFDNHPYACPSSSWLDDDDDGGADDDRDDNVDDAY